MPGIDDFLSQPSRASLMAPPGSPLQANPAFLQKIINGPNQTTTPFNYAGGGSYTSGPSTTMPRIAGFDVPVQGTPGGFAPAQAPGLLETYGQMFGAGLGMNPYGGMLAGNPEARDAFLKFAQGQQKVGLEQQGLGLEAAKQALAERQFGYQAGPTNFLRNIAGAMVGQGGDIGQLSGVVEGLKQNPELGHLLGLGGGGFAAAPGTPTPTGGPTTPPPPGPAPTATGFAPGSKLAEWLKEQTMPIDPRQPFGKRSFSTQGPAGLEPKKIEDVLSSVLQKIGPEELQKNFPDIWDKIGASYPQSTIQDFLHPGLMERAGAGLSRTFSPNKPSRMDMIEAVRNQLGMGMPKSPVDWMRYMSPEFATAEISRNLQKK